jgi:thioredoxin reductase (NADPH)
MSTREAFRPAAIMVVDDEREALDRLQRTLDRRFGADYRVIAERSAKHALEQLRALREEGVDVALVLADQWMPEMSGVDFLAASDDIHPDAKRAVLIEWGQLNSAREAILRSAAVGQIETYLLKPWREPDEPFYRAIGRFIEQWDREHRPQFEVMRIVGDTWDSVTQRLRDALHRSGVEAGFYEADSQGGRELLESAGVTGPLPVVVFFDGRVLVSPTPIDIANALEVNVDPAGHEFDVIVIGAGPAGLAAAVYGASEGLDVLVVETEALGGQASTSTMIRNYLGFPRGLTGADLATRAYWQAWFFGARFLIGRAAAGLRVENDSRVLLLEDGIEVRGKSIVLASGVSYRRLGIERLEALVGRGVFYGAPVTEAPGLARQSVAVVGGGNSSAQSALYLARFADRVTLIVRGIELDEMSSYLVQDMAAHPIIEIRLNTIVVDGSGDSRLRSLIVHDRTRDATEEIPCVAVFILIGGEPRTEWLPAEVARDERGYVMTGDDVAARDPDRPRPRELETSLPGVFAVGDVRLGAMKRVAGAVGEGSRAIRNVHEYLAELKHPTSA